jgi:hypothetical protein
LLKQPSINLQELIDTGYMKLCQVDVEHIIVDCKAVEAKAKLWDILKETMPEMAELVEEFIEMGLVE